MNEINYRKAGEKQIQALDGSRPKLLLHCCCAPCASSCLEYLKEHFNVTVYFFNPNICGDEYKKREDELKRFISLSGWADMLPCEHDEKLFYEAARGLESEKEGGARCVKCFWLRLENTAAAAKREGYGFFATTLTLSPLKNAKVINETGEKIALEHGVTWLYNDFKKQNGYLRSLELSREYGLYRQDFCGCVYSKR